MYTSEGDTHVHVALFLSSSPSECFCNIAKREREGGREGGREGEKESMLT